MVKTSQLLLKEEINKSHHSIVNVLFLDLVKKLLLFQPQIAFSKRSSYCLIHFYATLEDQDRNVLQILKFFKSIQI